MIAFLRRGPGLRRFISRHSQALPGRAQLCEIVFSCGFYFRCNDHFRDSQKRILIIQFKIWLSREKVKDLRSAMLLL